MANSASATTLIIGGTTYGQVIVTNSAGHSSTVMTLAASGGLTGLQRAQTIRDRLNNLFASGANFEFITPGATTGGDYVVRHTAWGSNSPTNLATVTNEDVAYWSGLGITTRHRLSLEWANKIRDAIDRPSLCVNPDTGISGNLLLTGGYNGVNPVVSTWASTTASWYGYETAYRPTWSGECWHPYDNTCAIWAMSEADTCQNLTNYVPMGVYIRVTNLTSGANYGKQVIVRVTDRQSRLGICQSKQFIDLSKGAAQAIGMDVSVPTIATVKLERLS